MAGTAAAVGSLSLVVACGAVVDEEAAPVDAPPASAPGVSPEPGDVPGAPSPTPPTPPDAGAEERVPGVFVAVGDGHERVSSRDGVTWEHRAFLGDLPGDADVMRDVAYGDGSFLCVDNGSRVFRSRDGAATWEELPGKLLAGPNGWGVGWVGGLVYAQGSFWGAGGVKKITRTQDGVEWTLVTRGSGAYRTLAYGNGTWLAAGDSGAVATSTDGATWTTRTGLVAGVQAAAYGMGRFMLVGHGMSVSVLPDGGELESLTVPGMTGELTGSLRGVAYGEGRFYVTGESGSAVFDGTTWTLSKQRGRLGRVTFGVDPSKTPLLVSVSGGSIHRSLDGLSWERTYAGGFRLRGVTFGATGPIP